MYKKTILFYRFISSDNIHRDTIFTLLYPKWNTLIITTAVLFIIILTTCNNAYTQQSSVGNQTTPLLKQKIIIFGQKLQNATQKLHTGITDLQKKYRIKGFIEADGYLDIHNHKDNKQNNAFYNKIQIEGKYDFINDIMSDKQQHLILSLQSEYLWFGPENGKDDYELSIYEGYYYFKSRQFELKTGKQIVRWGKTDHGQAALARKRASCTFRR